METFIRKQTATIISVALALIGFAPYRGVAQEKSHNFSLVPYFKVLDTIDRDGKNPLLKVQWVDTTIIDLRIPSSSSSPEKKRFMAKMRELYEKKGEVFDSARLEAQMLVGLQNCHSYALERYLASKDVEGNSLFNASTSLFNREMAKVLNLSFKQIQRFTAKEFKKNQGNLPRKTLLVFKDKHDIPIHTVFYDQGFHSKNGAFAAHTFPAIQPLLKSYFDTVWIDQFEIDFSKFPNHKN